MRSSRQRVQIEARVQTENCKVKRHLPCHAREVSRECLQRGRSLERGRLLRTQEALAGGP